MEKAEMKVIYFDSNDVIATSKDSFVASNLGDNNVSNNTLNYLGVDYQGSSLSNFYSLFNANNNTAIGADTSIGDTTQMTGNDKIKTLGKVFGKVASEGFKDSADGTTGNGTYVWDATNNIFRLQ